jgi:hypothetical protein
MDCKIGNKVLTVIHTNTELVVLDGEKKVVSIRLNDNGKPVIVAAKGLEVEKVDSFFWRLRGRKQ